MTNAIVYQDILETINTGDIDKAKHSIERALKDEPNDAKLHYLSGEVALLQEHHTQALKAFHVASQSLPEKAEIWGGISEAASALGDYQKSFEAGYKGLNLGILTSKQVTCTAISMAMLGEIEGGKSLLIAQTEEFSDDGQSWVGLGVIMMMEKNTSRAITYYKKAIILDPDIFEAQAGLGKIYLEQHKYTQAAQYFSDALSIKPNYLPAHEGLIESLWQLNAPQECLDVCESLLQTQPLNRTANLRYGMSLFALNRDDDGENHFQKILQHDSENIDISIYFGGYLEQKGQFERALNLYKEAHKNCYSSELKDRLARLISQREKKHGRLE